MGTISRRAAVLVALFAGAVFGSMVSGCAFVWLGVARADGAQGAVVDVPCDVQGTGLIVNGHGPTTFAVATFDGRSKEDLAANVYVVRDAPTADTDTTVPGVPVLYRVQTTGGGSGNLVNQNFDVADGKVVTYCSQGQASVRLFVR